jgi:hypothetical protein
MIWPYYLETIYLWLGRSWRDFIFYLVLVEMLAYLTMLASASPV